MKKTLLASVAAVSMLGSSVAMADAEKNYADFCGAACHSNPAMGLAIQAPQLGDAAAWKERLAKGRDVMLNSVLNGIGVMPPLGGTSLSPEQAEAVLDYMISKSK